MNVMQAKTFLELLAARNFNKAAERLCVTQSCVTLRIKSLEQILGQRLFIRTKSGVELTVAGRRLQPFAESLVQVWQQARKELALPPDVTTMLSVGCDPGVWHGYIGNWLQALRADQASVALEVEVRHSTYLMERLAQGLLHAAVVYEPHLHHGMVVEPLFEDKLILVTREPRERARWHPRYVLVQWTAEFRAQHDAVMPVDITPPVVFADGVFALDFILRSGGSGYFPLRMIIDHLRRRELFYVGATRAMNCKVHLAYSEPLLSQPWFRQARARLLSMCEDQRALIRDHIDNGAIEQWTGLRKKAGTDKFASVEYHP